MKICIFTASRSEYGLLKGLIKKIHLIKNTKLSLIVSGSHLSTKYGLSINEIKKDKFKINKKIYINLEKDSNWDVANAFAETSKKINKYFKSKKFDLVILLGDRYEALSVAISSYINRFPIAHIHGGEKTLNSLDDNFRHSISKLSAFHFVSHISNKKRLIQLGEDKKKILEPAVSSSSLDSIENKKEVIVEQPTKDELNLLYENKEKIGGFAGNYYWSSTEQGNSAWIQDFNGVYQSAIGFKGDSYYVRAVRAF